MDDDELRRELRSTVARIAELTGKRDDLIRRGLSMGIRVVVLATDADLTRGRIYQIGKIAS